MVRLESVRFRYEKRDEATIKDINLSICQGERVLISGRTGCGKSTLLKIVSGLIPSMSGGEFQGQAWIDGMSTKDTSPARLGEIIGTVYQNPDDQLFAMTVEDEVAFALENRGVSPEVVKTRVHETLSAVGLDGMEERSIHALSGGQRQRLALASVLVTRPKVLILDEPVSQLNPQAVSDFLQLLLQLNEQQGITLIVVEHRVHELAAYFPRLVLMSEGSIIYDGQTAGVWDFVGETSPYGLREPENIQLSRLLGLSPLISNSGKLAESICKVSGNNFAKVANPRPRPILSCEGNTVASFSNIEFTYPGGKEKVLKNISFAVCQGEVVALMGNNGAGKSTALNLLAGLTIQDKGKIELLGSSVKQNAHKVGYLRQEPDLMLLRSSVYKEVAFGPKKSKEEIEKVLNELDLYRYFDDYPLALSKGQRLRVVLASLLAGKPELLLLDEPTTGQDYQSLVDIKKMIAFYKNEGGSVLFCTHDSELAADIADRVIVFEKGMLIKDDTPERVFCDSELIQRGGLNPLPMLILSRLLGIPPLIRVKEVADYVGKTALGRC